MKRKLVFLGLLVIVLVIFALIILHRQRPVDGSAGLARIGESEVVYGEVTHPYFAMVAISGHGDFFAVGCDRRRIVCLAPDLRAAVLELNAAGLPETIYDGGHVIVLENYTSDTVDVGVILPDGSTRTHRGIELPPALHERLAQTGGAGRFDAAVAASAGNLAKPSGLSPDASWFSDRPGTVEGGPSMSELLSMTGMAITIGATAVTAAGLLASVPVWAPAAAVGVVVLGGVTVGTSAYNMLYDNQTTAVGEIALNGIACATIVADPVGGSLGCLTMAMAIANEAVVKPAENSAMAREKIELLRAAVRHGGGDIQITLTWDTAADLDLWVIDPNGEQIGYKNKVARSNGQLDVDDQDGHGPENIFWPPGQAPSGQYEVRVHHYSPRGLSTARLLVQVDGRSEMHTATLQGQEWKTIAKFQR